MKTILLGLNELNFDYIRFYSEKGLLPNFQKVFKYYKIVETASENEHKLLEPWIQWATVHTGKSYNEHQIFRLGDIVDSDENQFFEHLEFKGYKIGAVSPFNAKNVLKNPAFFIPDPWTITQVSGNWFVKAMYRAVHQSVNDNASGKLSFGTLATLAVGVLRVVPFKKYPTYLKYFIKRKKPGTKAVILDGLLADTFMYLYRKHNPDFSNLFLNSGAHIQHHYLFNSEAYNGKLTNPEWYCEKDYDPLIVILQQYDRVIGELLKSNVNLFLATGLHQQPHEHLTFYWRINKHAEFVHKLGLKGISQVIPRMSRDFLIKFDSEQNALEGEQVLNSLIVEKDQSKVFSVDNRGDSLFIELIYSSEIFDSDSIRSSTNDITIKNFKNLISFVAIKNGEHNGIGYFVYDPNKVKTPIPSMIKLTEVRGIIEESVLS
jgi:hypothetical protein